VILRDARGRKIDLGARQSVAFSSMKMIGTESTGSGGWDRDMKFLFTRPKREPVERPVKLAKVKVVPVPAPRPPKAARVRSPRLAPGQAAANRRAYQIAYRAAHRRPRPAIYCVQCDVELPASSPRDRLYCSVSCRGKWERAHR
jgi:hypothetical protein